MFYQEAMVGGVFCYRTTPDGDWVPFTLESLTFAHMRLTDELTNKKEEIAKLKEELEMSKSPDSKPHFSSTDSPVRWLDIKPAAEEIILR